MGYCALLQSNRLSEVWVPEITREFPNQDSWGPPLVFGMRMTVIANLFLRMTVYYHARLGSSACINGGWLVGWCLTALLAQIYAMSAQETNRITYLLMDGPTRNRTRSFRCPSKYCNRSASGNGSWEVGGWCSLLQNIHMMAENAEFGRSCETVRACVGIRRQAQNLIVFKMANSLSSWKNRPRP